MGTLTEPTVAFTVPLADMAPTTPGKRSAQRAHVAAAGVDHQAAHASGNERRRKQFAEHAIRAFRAATDDQHVTRAAEFDGDVQHPVVAGMREYGDGAAGDPAPG